MHRILVTILPTNKHIFTSNTPWNPGLRTIRSALIKLYFSVTYACVTGPMLFMPALHLRFRAGNILSGGIKEKQRKASADQFPGLVWLCQPQSSPTRVVYILPFCFLYSDLYFKIKFHFKKHTPVLYMAEQLPCENQSLMQAVGVESGCEIS